MSEPTEEEKMENTRRLFANYKPKEQWYHSILDPEAKVIYNDKGEVFIRDPKLWRDFVSNTWLDPKRNKEKKPNDEELEI